MKQALVAALCLFTGTTQAQIRISEFLASNTQSHPDIVDFGDYPDWIELENTTAAPVSLAGWYLSDDPKKPFRWTFPSNATLPAHGHLVVWADGEGAVPGESHPRGYWPWREFTTEGYHANFSLSALGESVVLTHATGSTNLAFITAGTSRWKYLDDGSNAGTAWTSPTFEDVSWAGGAGQLGYGDGDETTILTAAAAGSTHPITTYFRHAFTVADPGRFLELELRLLADDGAVVYLNGTEVVRQNLPAGAVDFKTLTTTSISGTAENAFTTYRIPSTHLVAGTNVVAVEVHQSAANSSDLGFDLSLSGTGFTGSTNVDLQNYDIQIADVSRGRNAEGQWVQFATPTPGAPNTGAEVPDLRLPGIAATVSPEGGVFDGPVTVTLAAASGTVRYTLTGAVPTPTSTAYSKPITLTSNTVVRARVFAEGRPPGPIATRTYLIGEAQGTLPFVSVVSDPELLFGDRLGIYYNQHEPVVSGGSSRGLRDVYKNKDAPGSLEFFAPGGQPGFRVNGAFRMGGENNWVHAQRALNFALRGAYGNDSLAYDLFPGTGIPNHTSLTLRDGGDAWSMEMLRDGLWSFLQRGQMRVGVSDYRPSVVFINGAYWGIHDVRSRWDDAWFFEHHRLNATDIDHLLYGHQTSSAITLGADKGDTGHWLELLEFAQTHDLNDPTVWAVIEARVDIESFIDFIASESWGQNTSWAHNREFWRPRTPSGRWQWFLPDMDQTFRSSQLASGVLGEMLSSDQLLSRLKTGTRFRQRLAQRMAAHADATFRPARVQGLLDAMAQEVESEVPRHAARWSSLGGLSASGRAAALADMKKFIEARSDGFLAEIQNRLGLSPAVALTLGVSGATHGRIVVEGVPVDPGVHRLFPGIPLTLTAEAAPGFRFVRWSGSGGASDSATTATTTRVLTGPETLTAEFAPCEERVIGGSLASTTRLTAGATYALDSDLIIPRGMTLTIPAGVTLLMPAGRHLRVQGALNVAGSAESPVRLVGREGARWGGLSFENPDLPSELHHVVIRQATRGADPVAFPYALSGLNAQLLIEHLDLEQCDGPIFCRGGSIVLRHSRLHTPYTGDCINVKRGAAITEDCDFIGNNAPDTDAIDYDGVVGGVVRNCRIHRFQGPNCDGIDIGEEARDILIENNRIYFNSDKGVSVGQGSTVILRNNLVVGCALGVGVKDAGSRAIVDQNTFVGCAIGVDVYEKNFGVGGGSAFVTNTIFSRSGIVPAQVDSLSQLVVSYSLSDTVGITGPGAGNRSANPLFVAPEQLDFSLQPGSPAIDAGAPDHPTDPDGTRADIGARYRYQAADYPYAITKTVVIDEVLANSEGDQDWIELFNRSGASVDLSGWFLSDSATDLRKYRIPAGTRLEPGERIFLSEQLHFGVASLDPGRITGFALSDVGETVYLSSAQGDELTDYRTQESFGASLPGETLGNYRKVSTDTWNFIPLQTPTPGKANSAPRIGPIVISEIFYASATDPDLEFIELLNITTYPVPLYDSVRGAAWRITDGIELEFPSNPPLILASGERLVVTRSLARFNAAFTVPAGTRVLEWASGRLANEGESVQLGRPAGLNDAGIRQFARVDRVNYDRNAPWPVGASGSGQSLQKRADADYGNDPAAWLGAMPTPGTALMGTPFSGWITTLGVPVGQQAPGDDPDHDGRPNLLEFALGSHPLTTDTTAPLVLSLATEPATLRFGLRLDRPGVSVQLQRTTDLAGAVWNDVATEVLATEGSTQTRIARQTSEAATRFFRLIAR
jgi:hypothetical protein